MKQHLQVCSRTSLANLVQCRHCGRPVFRDDHAEHVQRCKSRRSMESSGSGLCDSARETHRLRNAALQIALQKVEAGEFPRLDGKGCFVCPKCGEDGLSLFNIGHHGDSCQEPLAGLGQVPPLVGANAPLSNAAASAKIEAEKAVNEMRDTIPHGGTPSQFEISMESISKVIRNARDIDEKKFRKLRRSNAEFNGAIGQWPAAVKVLYAAGFEDKMRPWKGEEDIPYLILEEQLPEEIAAVILQAVGYHELGQGEHGDTNNLHGGVLSEAPVVDETTKTDEKTQILEECAFCKRKFSFDRIAKHETRCVAAKPKIEKRDVALHLLGGTVGESLIPDVRRNIKHGVFLPKLRIPSSEKYDEGDDAFNTGLQRCPHCARQFGEEQLEKHLVRCRPSLPSASSSTVVADSNRTSQTRPRSAGRAGRNKLAAESSTPWRPDGKCVIEQPMPASSGFASTPNRATAELPALIPVTGTSRPDGKCVIEQPLPASRGYASPPSRSGKSPGRIRGEPTPKKSSGASRPSSASRQSGDLRSNSKGPSTPLKKSTGARKHESLGGVPSSGVRNNTATSSVSSPSRAAMSPSGQRKARTPEGRRKISARSSESISLKAPAFAVATPVGIGVESVTSQTAPLDLPEAVVGDKLAAAILGAAPSLHDDYHVVAPQTPPEEANFPWPGDSNCVDPSVCSEPQGLPLPLEDTHAFGTPICGTDLREHIFTGEPMIPGLGQLSHGVDYPHVLPSNDGDPKHVGYSNLPAVVDDAWTPPDECQFPVDPSMVVPCQNLAAALLAAAPSLEEHHGAFDVSMRLAPPEADCATPDPNSTTDAVAEEAVLLSAMCEPPAEMSPFPTESVETIYGLDYSHAHLGRVDFGVPLPDKLDDASGREYSSQQPLPFPFGSRNQFDSGDVSLPLSLPSPPVGVPAPVVSRYEDLEVDVSDWLDEN